jgi:hypothetical protein
MSDWSTKASEAMGEPTEEEQTQSRVDYLESMLLDSAGLRNIPSPIPLIDGYLFKNSLSWIGGLPGDGKSFVGIEIASCIGTGLPWFGHNVTQGKVLYIIAEGAGGFSDRVETWEQFNGTIAKNVTYLPIPVQFLDDIDVAALGQLMWRHRYDVVVFDTQARCTVGLKENDTTDMGVFVHKLEQLRQMYGACLLLIHHMPRNGEHLRGSISMEGAANTVLLVSKEGPQVTITTAKQKDIEAPPPFELQLMPHHKSAVLVEIREGESTLSPTQMALLALVREHHDEWVSKSEVKATAGLPDPTFYRNVNDLIKSNHLEQIGDRGRPKYLKYTGTQRGEDK